MTLNITTFSIRIKNAALSTMPLSIAALDTAECCYAERRK